MPRNYNIGKCSRCGIRRTMVTGITRTYLDENGKPVKVIGKVCRACAEITRSDWENESLLKGLGRQR